MTTVRNTMKKLYEKNELTFALIWIGIYCLLQSLANPLNELIGIQFSASAVLCALQAAVILVFLKKNGLFEKYGLCKASFGASRFLFYIPLLLLMTRNLWNGVANNMPLVDTLCYLTGMLCVGFVEELIFRGFLFKAMEKSSVRSAVIVSSITFGLGHFLNLINGSGAELWDNVMQVTGAIAIGFLFVTVFHRGGSLIPCIAVHSVINMTSAFAREDGLTAEKELIFQLVMLVIAVAYTLILTKTLPKKAERG